MRLLLLLLPLALHAAEALPPLHPLFTDRMVLPRGAHAPVWGWAPAGTQVHVKLGAASAVVRSGADGRWQADLGPLKAGGPYDLVVEGRERIVRHDVLVGDVWLCVGQSNMAFPLSAAVGGAEEVAASAAVDGLRLYDLGQRIAGSPRALPAPGDAPVWQRPEPASTSGFSAVAWFTGRALRARLGVPIGVVVCAWPGSNIRGWMRGEALDSLDAYIDERRDLAALAAIEAAGGPDVPAQERAKVAAEEQRRFQGANGAATMLWNGGIAPLVPFAFAGVAYYQGEQDAGNPAYGRLLPVLIADWRTAFAAPALPFVLVGLPAFHDPVPEPVQERITFALARASQVAVARSMPAVGLAVTTDLGEANEVHPRRKREVGERIAAAAQAIVAETSGGGGPLFDGAVADGAAMRVRWSRVSGGGLELRGVSPTGFAVAGADHAWHAATARIDGPVVVVASSEVPQPLAVRYGWADNPPVTLVDRAGFPAAPFRSDDP